MFAQYAVVVAIVDDLDRRSPRAPAKAERPGLTARASSGLALLALARGS